MLSHTEDNEHIVSNRPPEEQYLDETTLNIESYIRDYFYGGNEIRRSKTKTTIRLTAKTVAVMLGCVAGTPFIRSSSLAGKKFSNSVGGHLGFLQYILSGGVLVGYGLTSLWVLNEITNIYPKRTEQEVLLGKRRELIRAFRKSIVYGASFISTIPAIYVSLTYNEDDYLLLAIAILTTASYRVAGYDILFSAIWNNAKKLMKKLNIISGFYDSRAAQDFIEDLIVYLRSIEVVELEPNLEADTLIPYTQSLVATFRSLQENFYTNSNSIIKLLVTNGVVLINASCGYCVNSLFTTKVLDRVLGTSNNPGTWALSLAINLPSYCLDIYTNRRMTSIIYDSVRRDVPKNVIASRYKKTTISYNVIAFVLSILTMIGDMYVAEDNLTDSALSDVKWPIIIAMSITAVFFYSYAISDIFHESLVWFGRYFDPDIDHAEMLADRAERLGEVYTLSLENETTREQPDTRCLTNFFRREVSVATQNNAQQQESLGGNGYNSLTSSRARFFQDSNLGTSSSDDKDETLELEPGSDLEEDLAPSLET